MSLVKKIIYAPLLAVVLLICLLLGFLYCVFLLPVIIEDILQGV